MPRQAVRFRGIPARRPLPTPRPAFSFDTVAMLEELHKMQKDFIVGFETIKKALETFQSIKKGDQGIRGNDGPQGRPGRNGADATMPDIESAVLKYIKQPKDGVSPDPLTVAETLLASKKFLKFIKKNLKAGDPGKDAEVSAPDRMVGMVLDEIGKRGIPIAHIAGLDSKIAEIRNHKATGGWRGGGDDVQAGSNVTITRDTNGNKVINATGGSAAWSTPPETPDSIITVFTVGTQPTDVVADGVAFYQGAGYSYSVGQITFDNPPAQYVRYR